jgi:hypothetical protein
MFLLEEVSDFNRSNSELLNFLPHPAPSAVFLSKEMNSVLHLFSQNLGVLSIFSYPPTPTCSPCQSARSIQPHLAFFTTTTWSKAPPLTLDYCRSLLSNSASCFYCYPSTILHLAVRMIIPGQESDPFLSQLRTLTQRQSQFPAEAYKFLGDQHQPPL